MNSLGPEYEPKDAARRPTDERDQPTEDATRMLRESDPPIVLRDCKAGHTPTPRLRRAGKAKELAGSNPSKALTTGHVDPDKGVKVPACIGNRFWHFVVESVSSARFLRSPLR